MSWNDVGKIRHEVQAVKSEVIELRKELREMNLNHMTEINLLKEIAKNIQPPATVTTNHKSYFGV